MTKDDLAKQAGLRTYDLALPQPWLDVVSKILGGDSYGIILSGTVWCYDNSIFGFPVSLTKESKELLTTYYNEINLQEGEAYKHNYEKAKLNKENITI